jgi:hypothetical protein
MPGFHAAGTLERAAWKVGWAAYRKGDMSGAARYFESSATNFPRSDYPAGMAVLVGPCARRDGRFAWCDRGVSADNRRLSQHLYGRLAEGILRKAGCAARAEPPCVCAGCGAASEARTTIFHRPKRTIRTLLAAGLYEPA